MTISLKTYFNVNITFEKTTFLKYKVCFFKIVVKRKINGNYLNKYIKKYKKF